MTQKLIHINNLKKKYGQREVVSDVSETGVSAYAIRDYQILI